MIYMPDGTLFPTIGICSKLGTKNVAILGFGLGAAIGGLMGYMISKMPGYEDKRPLLIIGGALAVGTISAIGAYFTCSGVEVGVPVKRR